LCEDAIKVYEQYKNNKKCMIIMDPPYISTCNDYYLDHSMNIYEYLYHNNITQEKAKVYLILENILIIKLLFQHNNILFEYDKTYEASKKKTTHILISNTKQKI
jgi:nitrogenase molybdenum-iron protein alpha/beta subunit